MRAIVIDLEQRGSRRVQALGMRARGQGNVLPADRRAA